MKAEQGRCDGSAGRVPYLNDPPWQIGHTSMVDDREENQILVAFCGEESAGPMRTVRFAENARLVPNYLRVGPSTGVTLG
jgi:hypothetical protein